MRVVMWLMNNQSYNGICIFCLSVMVLGCQQANKDAITPLEGEHESASETKSVLLFRSLCLQQFDKDSIESVYGMPGQAWITEKVGDVTSENGPTLFLALGRSEWGTWRAPDPWLIDAISNRKIRSVIDANEDAVVFAVENIDWLSANRVELDICTYHKTIQLHGSKFVQLEFTENKWAIMNQGGCYVTKLDSEQ